MCLTSYTASVLTLIASTLLVSHLQPLIHGFSGLGNTNLNSSTLPLQTDSAPLDSTIDPSFAPNYQSPLDVLTTSFILASISSCQGRLANESGSCSDDVKPASDAVRMGHPLLGNVEELLMQDNVDSSKYSWGNPGSSSWFKWLKNNFNGWFKAPMLESFDYPPDWATSLSYRIDRGSHQSRLIPLHVY